MLAAAVLAFLAVWVVVGRPGSPVDRIRPVQRQRLSPGRQSGSWLESRSTRTGICVLAASGLLWAFGGAIAGLAGVPIGLALSWWLGRLEPPSAARAREEVDRDLALTFDLLAACIESGRPVTDAVAVVARAVGGALGRRLELLSLRLAMAPDVGLEWSRLAEDPQLAPLGRTMQRAVESGAAPAQGLLRLAEDHRRQRRTRSLARARSAGVKAAGPLALCFLPAFMVLGVVPTIAGAVGHLLQ